MNGVEQIERRTAISALEGRMKLAIAEAVGEEAARSNMFHGGVKAAIERVGEEAAQRGMERTEVLRRGFRGRMRWLFLGK